MSTMSEPLAYTVFSIGSKRKIGFAFWADSDALMAGAWHGDDEEVALMRSREQVLTGYVVPDGIGNYIVHFSVKDFSIPLFVHEMTHIAELELFSFGAGADNERIARLTEGLTVKFMRWIDSLVKRGIVEPL